MMRATDPKVVFERVHEQGHQIRQKLKKHQCVIFLCVFAKGFTQESNSLPSVLFFVIALVLISVVGELEHITDDFWRDKHGNPPDWLPANCAAQHKQSTTNCPSIFSGACSLGSWVGLEPVRAPILR